MKNRLYILVIIVLSMGFVGCHKIDVSPNRSCEEDRAIENNKKGPCSDDDFIREGDDDGEVITDPNHDEDEDQQTKK